MHSISIILPIGVHLYLSFTIAFLSHLISCSALLSLSRAPLLYVSYVGVTLVYFQYSNMHMHALACNSDNILIFSIALNALTYYTTHREQARDRVRERVRIEQRELAQDGNSLKLRLRLLRRRSRSVWRASKASFVSRCFAARCRTSSNMFAVQPGSLVTSSLCRPSFIICCRCFSAVAVVVGNFMLPVLFVAVVRRCCCCCC